VLWNSWFVTMILLWIRLLRSAGWDVIQLAARMIKIKVNIDFKKLSLNRVIRYFILSDLLLWGGWGLIGPIFALFVVDRIEGAGLVVVGAAAGIYWVVKSLFQIPVALFLDRHKGERDDFYTLVLSLILVGFTAMAFLLVHSVGGLFLVIFLQAIAFGCYTPSWSALFSRHLEKEHYAFNWSLDSTTIGLASGATAFLGGALARFFGFSTVFILASILAFASAFLLIMAPNLILPNTGGAEEGKKKPVLRDHLPGEVQK